MFKQILLNDLEKSIEDLGYELHDIVLYIPKNPDFGDYTTNLALQLANQKSQTSKHSPKEIAKEIIQKLESLDFARDNIRDIKVAGSGFINFFLKDGALMENVPKICDYSYLVNPEVEFKVESSKKILIEYAHPNTHKAFHIGHLRNIILGESIARLQEAAGNKVFRANYQGDIGLHVAKALWGFAKIEKEALQLISLTNLREKSELLGKAYTKGAKAYEESEDAKLEIQLINQQLYSGSPEILPLWQQTRKWSLDYFEEIYQILGVRFDRLFFESETATLGKQIVEENIDRVFHKDSGAVIFKGDEYGLHNRVFITNEGYPTYEAKDLGRANLERQAFPFDLAIHIVASDQSDYFRVMFKALEFVDEWFTGRSKHLAYGLVSLKGGRMSSRSGEVVTFDWLYDQIKERVAKITSKSNEKLSESEKEQTVNTVSIGAVKFGMLKFAPQTDIMFDIDKSISLEGDSGPYVQYTYARAKSVLRAAEYEYKPGAKAKNLEPEEREILRKVEHFELILEEAAKNFAPNTLALYLLDLAKSFNLFYQKHPIIKAEEKMELRLALTCATAVILKQGLNLLGAEAPERM